MFSLRALEKFLRQDACTWEADAAELDGGSVIFLDIAGTRYETGKKDVHPKTTEN